MSTTQTRGQKSLQQQNQQTQIQSSPNHYQQKKATELKQTDEVESESMYSNESNEQQNQLSQIQSNGKEMKLQKQLLEQSNNKTSSGIQQDIPQIYQQISTSQLERSSANKFFFYVYGGNYPETVVDGLMRRGNWTQVMKEEDAIDKCHFIWRPFNYNQEGYKKMERRIVRNPSVPFWYNHFENLKGLTTKTGLVRSLKQYYFQNEAARNANYQIFDSTPTTFLVPQSLDDGESSDFFQRYREIQKGYSQKERIPMKHCANNIWLIKPAAANQGRGIEIFNEMNDILRFISTRPRFTCWVVQKYVERPLLFKGRKFDIRVWALVTQKFDVYMYRNGYLRTSSNVYDLSNGNNFVHLTNNCLQKYGDGYGKFEEGNTVGFDVLQEYLDENFPDYKLNVKEHFIPRMKDLIIDSINSVKTQLNPSKRKNIFELFGYDFLIDEDFRLWLIEINTNPYFGVPNIFIANLLPKMMDDLLQLVIDPVFPPEQVHQNCQTRNDFELIYSDGYVPFKNSAVVGYVNQRRPFNISLYPIKELRQDNIKKTIKSDQKAIKQYKQNITLCSTRPQTQPSQQSIQLLAAPRRSTSGNENMISQEEVKERGITSVRKSQIIQKKNTFRTSSLVREAYSSNQIQKNLAQATQKSAQFNNISELINSTVGTTTPQSKRKSTAAFQHQQLNTTSKERPQTASIMKTIQYEPKKEMIIEEQLKVDNSNIKLKDRLIDMLTINNQSMNPMNKNNKFKAEFSEFEEVFQKVFAKIKIYREDMTNLRDQDRDGKQLSQIIEILDLIKKSDQITYLSRDKTILNILSLLTSEKIPTPLSIKLSEIIFKLSDKLSVKQSLLKQIVLKEITTIIQKKDQLNPQLIQNICLSLFKASNIALNDQEEEQKTTTNRESTSYIPGVTTIKEQMQKQAFELGLISFFQMILIKDERYLTANIKQKMKEILEKSAIVKQQIQTLKQQQLKIQEQQQMDDSNEDGRICEEQHNRFVTEGDENELSQTRQQQNSLVSKKRSKSYGRLKDKGKMGNEEEKLQRPSSRYLIENDLKRKNSIYANEYKKDENKVKKQKGLFINNIQSYIDIDQLLQYNLNLQQLQSNSNDKQQQQQQQVSNQQINMYGSIEYEDDIAVILEQKKIASNQNRQQLQQQIYKGNVMNGNQKQQTMILNQQSPISSSNTTSQNLSQLNKESTQGTRGAKGNKQIVSPRNGQSNNKTNFAQSPINLASQRSVKQKSQSSQQNKLFAPVLNLKQESSQPLKADNSLDIMMQQQQNQQQKSEFTSLLTLQQDQKQLKQQQQQQKENQNNGQKANGIISGEIEIQEITSEEELKQKQEIEKTPKQFYSRAETTGYSQQKQNHPFVKQEFKKSFEFNKTQTMKQNGVMNSQLLEASPEKETKVSLQNKKSVVVQQSSQVITSGRPQSSNNMTLKKGGGNMKTNSSMSIKNSGK